MGEKTLHQQLKAIYAVHGGQTETRLNGYQIDVQTPELLIEIQTRNFGALRPKLEALLPEYPLRVVYPIARQKWLVKQAASGEVVERRRSPRRGRWEHLFQQLVYLPTYLRHPHFSLEALLVDVEELRRDDGKGSWRRGGWSICDRRILTIVEQRLFTRPEDFLAFLPVTLSEPFSTRQLAKAGQLPPRLAYQMLYTLRALDLVVEAGRHGRSRLYSRQSLPNLTVPPG